MLSPLWASPLGITGGITYGHHRGLSPSASAYPNARFLCFINVFLLIVKPVDNVKETRTKQNTAERRCFLVIALMAINAASQDA